MKKTLIFFILFSITGLVSYAGNSKKEIHRAWLIDAYEFGKAGKNCSEIYYNYGLPNWTFSSDDPQMLKRLYNA